MNAMQLAFYLLFALSIPTVNCTAATNFLQKTGESIPLNSSDYEFPVHEDIATIAPELTDFFNRYTLVFGVHVFASKTVASWALQHVSRGLAKYLDQDEDGKPDEPSVTDHMKRAKAMMSLVATEDEYDNGISLKADEINSTLVNGVIKNDHPIWNCSLVDDKAVWVIAEIFQEELCHDSTKPYGAVPPGPPWGCDDAIFEEVYHLITHTGYGCAFPEVYGFRADAADPYKYPSDAIPSSNISRALDAMMGNCGAAYNHTLKKADGCFYTYDDDTCFYPCLINEYLHQAHIHRAGARDFLCKHPGDYHNEYAWCTQGTEKVHDPVGYALGGLMPILPSGHYSGQPKEDF